MPELDITLFSEDPEEEVMVRRTVGNASFSAYVGSAWNQNDGRMH
jgi:hypothetical protein